MSAQADVFDDALVMSIRRQLIPDGASATKTYFDAEQVDVDDYDKIIVCMSGGKDSIASVLHLIDLGVDMRRVELWHHDVDGREGSSLMDWPFMAAYNQQLALHLGAQIFFSWLEGGFEGEMLKENSYSRPHKVETPSGLITLERDKNRSVPGTRLRFPQVATSLQTRWCSSALKIDVGRRAINNQSRFDGKRILFITGERREESANRAKYNQLEPHACDRRMGKKGRHVDAWRPVINWQEEQIWDALKRHGIIAPVPYRLGWSRSSCMKCIYNSPVIWSTLNHYFPEQTAPIVEYEKKFGTTISRSKINVIDIGKTARPLEISDVDALKQAVTRDYMLPVAINPGDRWIMPMGAFGREGCGAV